jgi:iron complex transport system substrate-binding protein
VNRSPTRKPPIRRGLAGLLWLGAIGLAVFPAGCGRGRPPDQTSPAPGDAPPPRRIVSLAPSITETLFALGLGDRVVGVTRFCTYPAEALEKPRVGGYFDTSYEAVLSLQPDLVITLRPHERARQQLAALGVPTLTVGNETVKGIMDSIERIAEVTHAQPEAGRLLAGLRERIRRLKEATASAERPSVLVSAGRSLGDAGLKEVYIAGRGNFYSEMIALAGGRNAYKGSLPFPAVTTEGLLQLQPEVIFEMTGDLARQGLTTSDVVRQWAGLNALPAVASGRVHVLTNDYVTIPGPRFIQTAEDMARALHPALPWEPR